jgi:hypothetical protein
MKTETTKTKKSSADSMTLSALATNRMKYHP